MTALIVGGYGEEGGPNTTEIFPQGPTCSSNFLPSLPTSISNQPSLVQTSDEEILLCGGYGNLQKCLELKDNQWQEHSNLKNERTRASAVSMPGGIFLFGDIYYDSKTTWEWLPNESNQWQSGTTNIPGIGYDRGCAVKINDTEILLIGGVGTYKRLLKFNTNTNEFANLGDVLNQGRRSHACTRYEEKIFISGGYGSGNILSSTEIINLNDLTKAHTAGNLVQARYGHGLVVVHVDNKPTVLALGGGFSGPNGGLNSLNSIEIWNATSKTWRMTSMKLSKPRIYFGILSVPTRLLCP